MSLFGPRLPKALVADAGTVHAWGIDYAHGNGLTIATMRANGVQFCCRYISHDPAKDINRLEMNNLLGAGIAVVFNWESTGNELGAIAGAADAAEAQARLVSLGHPEAPIIFSPWDHDPAGHIPGILDYMRGAASVKGASGVGLYQGHPAIKAYFDAKIGKYGWQTYAWSGTPTVWDTRAQLQQYQNGVTMGPAGIDRDRAMAADYGQIPRPKSPLPPPVVHMPGTSAGPAKVGTGYRWVADGTKSLADVALFRGASLIGLIAVSAVNLNEANLGKLGAYITEDGVRAPMPRGLVFYTHNP